MEKYQRLRSGDSVNRVMKRSAMAMIELIFAIVIIAISVITIPSMMNVADRSAKLMVVDEDLMARLSGWTLDKFQARWDGNYSASDSGALPISTMADLSCSRMGGYRIGSDENISSMQCNPIAWDAVIPALGDGNVSKGIEELNGGSEPITITPSGGAPYTVTATYAVRYVDSSVATNGNIQTATWVLGSSTNMVPNGSLNNPTHLKRVVTRFQNSDLGVDTTLTFFKSNKGN
jgi:hypothetical protein